ncbi:hypothetical protein LS482_09880 [Sinomicrobium kalidii]|uniref:hypothetical protein n=1 Tax=Sinomicrobium kalidii TaxID=2900738 RepID=UPI001E2E7EDD|nr:hypothetical protein [Sinomicrobium kalidii]UGU18176.1 hypothetical protein LS482_09880 [Sinomicrobium kalidii]
MKTIHLLYTILFALAMACSGDDQTQAPEELMDKTGKEGSGEVPELQAVEIDNITTTTAIARGNIVKNGSSPVTERGVCWSVESSPVKEDHNAEASSVKAGGEFMVNLGDLEDNTTYYVRAYAVNEAGTAYGEEQLFKTRTAGLPVVLTDDRYAAGTETAFIRAEITADNGFPITERGVCWSDTPGATVEDNKVPEGDGPGSFRSRIDDLAPDMTYYVRAYATNSKGTAYGDEIEVQTIVKGNVTYTLHKEPDPSPELQEHYQRIEAAMESAADYYNNFTSIEKTLNVYYNPGVPTADGNINGTIRIGSNPSYQRTGTAMHEIMHTVGVGQHWMWNELISDGVYQGENANEILQFMEGDAEAVIKGDGLHFWPYGINGAHEDTGDEMLYITHALIMQGMKKDGLPSN